MPSVRVTRKLEFDAGHRVLGHGGKCRHLHGHRYVAEITVEARQLDRLGMVVDFSVIKEKVGAWIDNNLDHNILLHPDDPLVKVWDKEVRQHEGDSPDVNDKLVFGGRRPYVMPGRGRMSFKGEPNNIDNPTAENIATLLFMVAHNLLSGNSELKVVHVRVYETPNCWADCPALD